MAFNRTLQHFTSSQELATQWASGQSYILDQLVLESDKLYRCILAHTSGATFAGDSAYWSGINPGQTISIADGGTGQTTQTAAFDALAPTTTAGDLIVHNGTDNVRQSIGTDGQVLVVDTAQTNKLKWATIQQGSKNYIANSTFENGVTPPSSWSTFSTTIDSTTKIPTGSVTSDPTITLATSSSTPLAGTYSMLASSGAVTITTTGYGFISSAFTIDKEDQAKVMGFSFYYEAVSGTMNFSGTSSNTFAVYIRDVSGGAWIQPAGVYNLVQSSGVGLCSGTFQTTATGTQYQIAVLMINTVSAPGVSLRFDDFQVGPQKVLAGAAISDWVSYTPVMTGGAASAISGRWRKVGDSIHARVVATLSAGGVYQITVPFPADSSKFPNNAINVIYGMAVYGDTSGNVSYTGGAYFTSTTTVRFYGPANTEWSAVTPVAFGVGDSISLDIVYPAAGLSSNTVMSSDTDTRVVAARAFSSTSSAWPTTDTVINYSTVSYDTHASITTGAGWSYRVPVSGYYKVSASHEATSSGATTLILRIRKNGSQFATGTFPMNAATSNIIVRVDGQNYFNAGDTIDIAASSSAGTGTFVASASASVVQIERLSGPATIAASETVAVRANKTTGSHTNTANWQDVASWDTESFDTHGSFNTTTGIFTVPVSGKYLCSGTAYFAFNATGARAVKFQLNGTDVGIGSVVQAPSATDGCAVHQSVIVSALAGQEIKMQAFQRSGGNLSYGSTDGGSSISIVRVGN